LSPLSQGILVDKVDKVDKVETPFPKSLNLLVVNKVILQPS